MANLQTGKKWNKTNHLLKNDFNQKETNNPEQKDNGDEDDDLFY